MIKRLSLIGVAGVAGIALVSAIAAPAANEATRLVVRTGPGFNMTLKGAGGREVDWLRRGTYRITIQDTSRSHEFALYRWRNPPNFKDKKVLTNFAFVGRKTVTVTFKPGNYTYFCGRHTGQGMRGTLTVA